MDTWIVALILGSALALGFAALAGLVRDLGVADATWRDRPPTGFRLLWPLVNVMGNTFGFLLGANRKAALLARLHRGGQAYALTPQQFFGGKVLGLFVAGGVTLIVNGADSPMMAGGAAVFGFLYPDLWLRDHTKKRNLAILKALPFMLDIITLSIESGLNLTGAL